MPDIRAIDELLAKALQLDAGPERDAWLTAACAGDGAVEAELRDLIAAHENAGAFMGQSAVAAPAEALCPGTRVGRYELIAILGEGGFGRVWRAVQHAPVRREVALKILKPGRHTSEVVARFRLERQALAVMEHPNTARVFDADVCDDGRPYFVMEFVDGVPLLEYCRREALNTRARVELFLQVCRGIEHAHSKGVIHRDIKPGNLIVTESDGEPVPKIIDFGIAKATEGGSIADSGITTEWQMIGTPAYMAPEQARMSTRAVDTRSDVYALGAVLYELLTGVPPLDLDSVADASLEDVLRAVREIEPCPPSKRVEALGASADRTTTHASRLRGDLDWIVMKCLEKDPERRYATVRDLATDVRRHLDDEPVTAGPPSGVYRVRKFVRRHRAAVAAAALIVVALTVAIVGLAVGAVRSARAEAKAEATAAHATRDRKIAEAVNDFLSMEVLAAAPSPAIDDSRRDGRLGVLDEAAHRLGTTPGGRFTDEPLVEAAIRHTIGRTYRWLDDPEQAIEHLERAMALRRDALGDDARPTLVTANVLAVAYWRDGRVDEAAALFSKTLEAQERVLGVEDIETLRTMNSFAFFHGEQGRHDEAEALLQRALEIEERVIDEDHELRLGTSFNLAMLLQARGAYAEAEPLTRTIHESAKRTLGPDDPRTLAAMAGHANVLSFLGREDEAERLYVVLLERQRRVLGEEHRDTLGTMMAYGSMLVEQGRTSEAAPLLEGAVEIHERTLGPEQMNTLIAVNNLGMLYASQQRYVEALVLLERAAEGAARLWPDGHWITGEFVGSVGEAYLAQAQYEAAESKLLAAHALVEAHLGPDAPPTVGRIEVIVELYEAWDRADEATSWRTRLPKAGGGSP